MHANDKDEGKNAEIRYSLDSSLADVFSIDPSSGWVTNLVTLDREIRSSYIINIMAADSGSPVLNSTAKVYVNLVDSNDNPSLFTQAAYVASGVFNSLHFTPVECTSM